MLQREKEDLWIGSTPNLKAEAIQVVLAGAEKHRSQTHFHDIVALKVANCTFDLALPKITAAKRAALHCSESALVDVELFLGRQSFETERYRGVFQDVPHSDQHRNFQRALAKVVRHSGCVVQQHFERAGGGLRGHAGGAYEVEQPRPHSTAAGAVCVVLAAIWLDVPGQDDVQFVRRRHIRHRGSRVEQQLDALCFNQTALLHTQQRGERCRAVVDARFGSVIDVAAVGDFERARDSGVDREVR
mmetsp:Transcript_11308/g.21504  ORF Transcript_11308/g.21504 Transcript_11308/m.21504 type:complete len:245 (+) Transcript_11308:256-990(+)